MLNRMLSWSTSQTTGIYDYAFRQVCTTFGIDKFQGEQQKAIDMFFEGNDVSVLLPTGHGNTSRAAQAPVVRRSSCVISVKGIMWQNTSIEGTVKIPPTFSSLVVRKFILRIEKFSISYNQQPAIKYVILNEQILKKKKSKLDFYRVCIQCPWKITSTCTR